MRSAWVLHGSGRGLERFTYRTPGRGAAVVVRPVFTVSDLCRRLRRSRRQIYRYLRAGRLQPCGRVLGQWLFGQPAVDQFIRRSIPSELRPLFWDVPWAALAVDVHRDYILGRVLEHGGAEAVKWALHTYSRSAWMDFLTRRGAEVLSPRAHAFWSHYFGLRARRSAKQAWRARGRRWGGGG